MGRKIVIASLCTLIFGSIYFLTLWKYLITQINTIQQKLNQDHKYVQYFTLESHTHKESCYKLESQCSIKDQTTPWLKMRNYISNNRTLVEEKIQYLKSIFSTSISIQWIDFSVHNFSTKEITFYRLKETYTKYWQLTTGIDQVMIKVFNLGDHREYLQLKNHLNYTVNSINYLSEFETGSLFWIQSKEGKWKSMKRRDSLSHRMEIINFILVNQQFKRKQLVGKFNIKPIYNNNTVSI